MKAPTDPTYPRAGFRRALLRWYGCHRRLLPWREPPTLMARVREGTSFRAWASPAGASRPTDAREAGAELPTPYRVWVSEVMLQQTQVARVLEYFERFVIRFPDVGALARARLDEVLRLWQGLGYYARARALHQAAKVVAKRFAGELPASEAALLGLPGVGRSTAGAILSIAFGQSVPVLDANVARVLVRLRAIENPWPNVRGSSDLWHRAAQLLDHGRPGDWNQALMELGALVCLPKHPRCRACPVRRWCRAFSLGKADELPRRTSPRAKPFYEVAVGVILRGGRVLICRRPAEGLLGGLWEFPGGKVEPGETPAEALRRELLEELGVHVAVGKPMTPVRHAYTHFRVQLHPFLCRLAPGEKVRSRATVKWVWPSQLDRYAVPAATLRIIAELHRLLRPSTGSGGSSSIDTGS
jgi:A/G-specific adenine glycosylase